tara:strand:- start:319 stop:453 length:135 start_codon:yes stop_codon:yes gene_type:complete
MKYESGDTYDGLWANNLPHGMGYASFDYRIEILMRLFSVLMNVM